MHPALLFSMGNNIKRPISFSEGMVAIHNSKLDPAVRYTLTLLLHYWFREPSGMGEFADEELAMIYSEDSPEDESEVIEVPYVKGEDQLAFNIHCYGQSPNEGSTCEISRSPRPIPLRCIDTAH